VLIPLLELGAVRVTTGEAETERAGRGRAFARSVGNILLPASNPVGTVYGTLAVGILFAAESTEANPALRDIGAVVGTLIVYWLAHAYAYTLAARLSTGESSDTHGVLRELGRQWTIVRGGLSEILVFLIALAFGVSSHAAVIAALISSIALLILFETIAATRGGLGRRELAGQIVMCLLMCAGILAIKFSL
jgi:cytochrome bd-type quinol oxidase subunit 2